MRKARTGTIALSFLVALMVGGSIGLAWASHGHTCTGETGTSSYGDGHGICKHRMDEIPE